MDWIWIFLFVVILLLLGLAALLVHSGLLHKIEIGTEKYPLPSVKIAYKFGTGPYRNTGAVFAETAKLAPKQKCLGIYYDDPGEVPSNRLRWVVGAILSEGLSPPDPILTKSLKSQGYHIYQLPKAGKAVITRFPYKNKISMIISIARVWPAIGKYIKETQLEAYPWIELCERNEETTFIGPLDHHDEFVVPEAERAANLRKDSESSQ